MRKRIAGKRLSRPSDTRRALLRSLLEALFTHDSIRTTLAKAKAVKPLVEKLITKAIKKDNASYARVQSYLFKKETSIRLINEIAPRFTTRPGGYTRIIKLGPRRSDFAEMAILELVEKGKINPSVTLKASTPRSLRLKEVDGEQNRTIKDQKAASQDSLRNAKIKNEKEAEKEKKGQTQEISKENEVSDKDNAKNIDKT